MDAVSTVAIALITALSSREAWAYFRDRQKEVTLAKRDVVSFLEQRVDRLEHGLNECTQKHLLAEVQTERLKVELAHVRAKVG